MLDIAKALKDIAQRFGLIADYVVEQGTSGIWTYRKWNSGRIECWSKQDIQNIAVSTAWGSVYYGTTGEYNFPDGFFTDVPLTNIHVLSAGGCIMSVGHPLNVTNSKIGAVYLIAPVKYTSVSYVRLNITVKGQWK